VSDCQELGLTAVKKSHFRAEFAMIDGVPVAGFTGGGFWENGSDCDTVFDRGASQAASKT
jgi:hypothetical protein